MPLTKLNFTGQPTISHVNLPAGSILQKQLFTLAPTTHISTTSTTSAQAGSVQVSITPKKANSKILIEVETGMTVLNSNPTAWELYEDSTAIITEAGNHNSPYRYGWLYNYSETGAVYGATSAKSVVNAGSTNSRTYKLYHKIATGQSGIAYTAHEGGYISMFATEIAQ